MAVLPRILPALLCLLFAACSEEPPSYGAAPAASALPAAGGPGPSLAPDAATNVPAPKAAGAAVECEAPCDWSHELDDDTEDPFESSLEFMGWVGNRPIFVYEGLVLEGDLLEEVLTLSDAGALEQSDADPDAVDYGETLVRDFEYEGDPPLVLTVETEEGWQEAHDAAHRGDSAASGALTAILHWEHVPDVTIWQRRFELTAWPTEMGMELEEPRLQFASMSPDGSRVFAELQLRGGAHLILLPLEPL